MTSNDILIELYLTCRASKGGHVQPKNREQMEQRLLAEMKRRGVEVPYTCHYCGSDSLPAVLYEGDWARCPDCQGC